MTIKSVTIMFMSPMEVRISVVQQEDFKPATIIDVSDHTSPKGGELRVKMP